jgi:hypothetical protein
MGGATQETVRELLLRRRGVAFLSTALGGATLPDDRVRAVELELAAVGYVPSTRLRARLARTTLDELVSFRAWALRVLLAHVGGGQKHEPLFRRFPDGVPADTLDLWWRKVLVHFLQAEGQPCLFCGRVGTTHVLDPCRHVVCDRCWDGASYSACPSCEHHVDRSSPFFLPSPERGQPNERVVFKLLDLGEDVAAEARALFTSLCERKQALSPVDRDALLTVLREHRAQVLAWLPAAIPVRENVAVVFGTLFQSCDPAEVLPHARRFMTTATDVLRFVAVLSGTDGSLQLETVFRQLKVAKGQRTIAVPRRVRRFKTAKLPRPLRRALLGVLEGMEPDRLVEDMLRHRSWWVWVGEFLHPHEHAKRFPNVARAFHVVRGKAPDGTPAPAFQGYHARVEQAARARDAAAMVGVLSARAGELARRLDHVLRLAQDDAARDRIVATFLDKTPSLATPVLLTLRSHLPARVAKQPARVYWPRGKTAMGVGASDVRPLLGPRAIEPVVRAIDAELLRRFAARPAFAVGLVDEALRDVVAPFNERTASRAAVSLPRGSRVAVPPGKLVRLFLHWCQPERGGEQTDLDLSVAFYTPAWTYVAVCSYYELQTTGAGGAVIARSGGDMRDAPWPDGATELVDVHRDVALAAGIRYAVMVVNAYDGMPFSRLERGFAGLMLRDDPGGAHFDPRTALLKFALDGEHGVFMPLVLDLRDGVLHWLDVHAQGHLRFNNVETSKEAITTICPRLMTYFASGVRPSMVDLALLHAAARCERVFVRGRDGGVAGFVRGAGEDRAAFHARLVRGQADEPRSRWPGESAPPALAVLHRGDVDLPPGSAAYALFRERVTPTLAAADLAG